MRNRHYAPMEEVVFYTVEVDGRKLPGIIPYKGEYAKTIDRWRRFEGVVLKEAALEDYAAVSAKTVLHKRIIKCFERHYMGSKRREKTVNRN